MDYAEYLANEIGPRPGGTEEEQQAALYIAEQFQKDAGFAANIEDFSTSSNYEGALAVLAGVTVIATLLVIIFPVLVIPAFILMALAAAVYALESYDRPIVSRFLSRGASQNVVAKYQPNYGETSGRRARTRKIVLVAHYDTGRVTPALVKRLDSLGLPMGMVGVVAMIVAAFLMLIRIILAPGGGMGLLVLNVLAILAAIVCLIPIVRAVLMRTAPYNEGANNNATGTAALLEVARRIARGSVSEADLADEANDVTIHGEEAARAEGLVPEGARIRYEAESIAPPAEIGVYDAEERLLSAKAAVAAFTGKSVDRRVFGSVADKLVNSRASDTPVDFVEPSAVDESEPALAAVVEAPEAVEPVAAPVEAEQEAAPIAEARAVETPLTVPMVNAPARADGFENAPSWFINAQQNAKKAAGDDPSEPVVVQRSKYTEAFDYAERERQQRMEELRAAEMAERERLLRLQEAEARAALISNAGKPQPETAEPESAFAEAVAYEPAQGAFAEEPAIQNDVEAYAGDLSLPELSEVGNAPEELDARHSMSLPDIDYTRPAKHSHDDLVKEVPQVRAEVPETTSPSKSGLLRRLRTSVPSLSGLISPVEPDASEKPSRRRSVSVPSVVNVPTPAEEPVPSTLNDSTIAMSAVDYGMEVPFDADAYEQSARYDRDEHATAAPAAEVNVPHSRAGNLLGKLRREKGEDLAETPQQWLDVDDDFDARSVGRARGSWESFRDDQYFDDDDSFDTFGTGDDDSRGRRWQGGAYSRVQLGHVDMRSGEDTEADEIVEFTTPEAEEDRAITGEIEQIYHFRNPQFNTEIWFVAMGSDGEGHDGAKAFLNEHRDDLRGAMVIEIESLGAGELSVASEEGRVSKLNASSRIKRYTRHATETTGIELGRVSLVGSDSIASTMQRAGCQAMHLFGAEDGAVALKGSADDVMENVDELLLDEHVNYVFELLKN